MQLRARPLLHLWVKSPKGVKWRFLRSPCCETTTTDDYIGCGFLKLDVAVHANLASHSCYHTPCVRVLGAEQAALTQLQGGVAMGRQLG